MLLGFQHGFTCACRKFTADCEMLKVTLPRLHRSYSTESGRNL